MIAELETTTQENKEYEFLDLVLRAQLGDNDAAGELVNQFEPMVYSVALKRLRNASEAREVTQDIFVQVFRKIDQLREPERFPGWLKRIAVRMSINRAVRKPPETLQSNDSFALEQADPSNPLEDALRDERAHQLRGSLDRLRDLDRETLIAFYFEGQSLKEMSDQFDSPIGTIKRRLHTARNRLKDELVGYNSL